MFRLIVKPLAENDAAEAAAWYNGKRKGLGSEFLLALDAKMHEIERNPMQFQVVYKNVRRALTRRFPYGIFFIVEDTTIHIIAILHTNRNPVSWQKRD